MMTRTTVYVPEEMLRELKRTAKERGISEAELFRTALGNELRRTPDDVAKRTRLLSAIGALDDSVYPPGYLEDLRSEWRD